MPEAGRYRRSAFVVDKRVDEGTLLFNTLTKQMVLLEEGDKDNEDVLRELWHGMFLVAADADERKNALEVRQLAKVVKPRVEGYSSYVISPTTHCNARCFYCFELKSKKMDMSHEMAEKVAQFIIDHKPKDAKKIKIRWFGGEPLYNISAIDCIVQRLKDADVPFSSSIVTNGYLCTPEVAKKAKDEWNTLNVQITLDGTEERYNKIKAYKQPKDSPYRTVLSNIRSLAEIGVKVTIRMNLDERNIEDMFALVRELDESFPDKKHISIYTHFLFQYDYQKVQATKYDDFKRLFERQQELNSLIAELGFERTKGLSRDIKVGHCMADNDRVLSVMPDGHLGKCEHYCDSNFVGHIDDAELDAGMLKKFKEVLPEYPRCAECAYYPDCIRLKMCETDQHCSPEDQMEKLIRVRKSMVRTYNKYKERNEKE